MTVYIQQVDPSTADYVAVATVAELPSGARKLVELDGLPLAVFNIAGAYYAIADVCSHDDGPVAEGDLANEYEIECPRHGARFDVRTGAATKMPAFEPVPTYEVQVAGDDVLVESI